MTEKPELRQEAATQVEADLLPPARDPDAPNVYAAVFAQISQHPERPDLLLEVIERHDPGFIASMNRDAAEFSKKTRETRFNFGKLQAHASLWVKIFAAVCILLTVFYLAYAGTLGFWLIVGFGILYAITQGGATGFMKIISGVADMISGKKPPDQTERPHPPGSSAK